MGGRKYRSNESFSEWDSNTISDITGFRVKMSDVARRWDGIYAEPRMIEPRQPQDFPVTPQKQVVFKNVRVEQVEADGEVEFSFSGSFDGGFSAGFDTGDIPII